MDVAELLLDMYGRVPGLVDEAVDGLTAAELHWQPAPHANTIGWLVWHLTRVTDSQIADLDQQPQEWVTGDWASRFDLDPSPENHGYGHTIEQMLAVRPSGPDQLLGYFRPVFTRALAFVGELTASDLDQVVDDNWDPPVTLGVRLISIADDCLEHAGQANYLRGLVPA